MNPVHCKKHPFDQYIGRPKAGEPWRFGNPFVIGVDKDGPRSMVIFKFEHWLETGKAFGCKDATEDRRLWILENIEELRGKTLGCWCDYPKEDCHGRVLLERLEKNKEKNTIMFGTDFMDGECNGHNMYDANPFDDGFSGPAPQQKAITPKKGYKTIIAGGRDITDYNLLWKVMELCSWGISEVVCGGAKGVDANGKRWAEENDIPVKMFPADWDGLGKSAGFARNKQMAEYAEAAIIIMRNDSKGSTHMLNLAKEHNLKILTVQRWN
jgi:hypothetical protein